MKRWGAWILVGLPIATGAQTIAPTGVDDTGVAPVVTIDRRGVYGLEAWAGIAPTSANLGFLGNAPDLALTLAAVRVTRALHRTPGVAFDYMIDVVPVARLSRRTLDRRLHRIVCRSKQMCSSVADDILLQGNATGFGVSPVGLTAVLRPAHALEIGFGGTGGILWFDERVPTSGAARLNFTATAETGIGVVDKRGRGPFLMYRFHHISNGGRADENPAIASHVLSAGVRWRLSGR
jgi:hypothetical protein